MIGEEITTALPLMRAHAESLMTRTCTIERLTSSWDEAQQKTVTTWSPVSSPAYYVPPADTSDRTMVTDQVTTLESLTVHVPHSVAGIEPDDRVTLADGSVVWVTGIPSDDFPVEVRIKCRWVK